LSAITRRDRRGDRSAIASIDRCDGCCVSVVLRVRENVCNNSKKVKVMFLDFEKKRKNVKNVVQFQMPLNHSGL